MINILKHRDLKTMKFIISLFKFVPLFISIIFSFDLIYPFSAFSQKAEMQKTQEKSKSQDRKIKEEKKKDIPSQKVSGQSLPVQAPDSTKSDGYYFEIIRRVNEWKSIYSPDIYDYLIRREFQPKALAIYIDRFEKIKGIMKELLDLRLQLEMSKISNFFSDKMKPFLEVENTRREDLMGTLQKYVKNFSDSPLAPYAILRYAEILYEKLSYEYIQAYEQAILEGRVPPQKDFSAVIKIYEDFLKKYKDFPMKDAVMYLAGYILDEMGMQEEAVEKYFVPLSEIRLSQFAAEAAMRSGEFYFNIGELEKAEKFYLVVLDFPESPFYSKALYKLAWTYFRKGDYSAAIDYFVETIDASYGKETSDRLSLINESLDYIITSIVELGGFDSIERSRKEAILSVLNKVYPLVSQIQDNPEAFLLEAQGRVFLEQGKYTEAMLSFKNLIDRFYLSPRSIRAAFGIFEALKKSGDISGAISWQVKMAEKWGPGSEWAEKNKDELGKNVRKLEEGLLEAAKYYHSKGMFSDAESSYILFLKFFPDSEFSAEVQFLLGELYFNQKKFSDSFKYYKMNVENTKVKQNKFIQDAAWGMVISADQALSAGMKDAPENLKNAAFLYERLFPLDRRVPIALYKAAKVISSEGKKDEALFMFSKIIERYPGSEVVADSMLEILKIYIEKGDLMRVLDFSLQARERKDIFSSEDIKYINDAGAKALFSIASNYEKSKNFQEAISYYLKIPQLFPDSEFIDDALYSVVMMYYEMKKYDDVLEFSDEFLKKFPQSDLRFDVLYVRAVALSSLFFFDQALETYVRLETELKNKKNLSDIEKDILNKTMVAIISIYTGLGKFNEAAEWTLKYYNEFGKSEKDPLLYVRRAADLYEKAGNIQKMRELLSSFIKEMEKQKKSNTYDVVYAKYKIAKSLEKSKPDEMEKIFSDIINTWQKLSDEDKRRAVSIYAEAKFHFAKKTFDEYKKIRITGDEKQKQLADKLKKKSEMLKKVQNEMGDIAKLGDPNWSFAAIYYMGFAFQDFADMLINSPLPPEIRAIRDPEERSLAEAVYREELEKQAFPLEDSAIKIFSGAVDRIKQLGVRNEWTALIFKHLKMLDPLAPVEVEDDIFQNVALTFSMKSYSIPPIEETKEEKSVFAKKVKQKDIFKLSDPENLRLESLNAVMQNLFSGYFVLQSEKGLFYFDSDKLIGKRD
jgi:tetratricopeptide (TPR) repeat protein